MAVLTRHESRSRHTVVISGRWRLAAAVYVASAEFRRSGLPVRHRFRFYEGAGASESSPPTPTMGGYRAAAATQVRSRDQASRCRRPHRCGRSWRSGVLERWPCSPVQTMHRRDNEHQASVAARKMRSSVYFLDRRSLWQDDAAVGVTTFTLGEDRRRFDIGAGCRAYLRGDRLSPDIIVYRHGDGRRVLFVCGELSRLSAASPNENCMFSN